MIDQAARQAARDERDFLSVSFGYTAALWHFWRRAGFQLVRMGTHREASSDLYSAMALLSLSDAGRELTRGAAEGFERDCCLAAGELQPLALAAHLALCGEKALWRGWRQETAAAMTAVDARLTRRWRCFSQQPVG